MARRGVLALVACALVVALLNLRHHASLPRHDAAPAAALATSTTDAAPPPAAPRRPPPAEARRPPPAEPAPPHAPPRPASPGRDETAVPLHPSSAHGLPFALYHAFAAERDGCAAATFVGQLEGACDARERTLERAGLDDWRAWRADLVKEKKGCQVCVSSQWRTKVRKAVAAALNAEFASRATDRNKLALYCAFSADGGAEVVVSADAADAGVYLKARSTFTFTCPVPEALRGAACARGGGVVARVATSKAAFAEATAAHPAIPVVLQRRVPALEQESRPTIAACAWVRGGAYLDRDNVAQGLPAARVAEWLAHLLALGVDHVAIMDNSDGVYAAALRDGGDGWRAASPLQIALAPLPGGATHVAWPAVNDDRSESCDPAAFERRVVAETNGTLTTQGMFGRPSQYAAQNACHRRAVAAGASWVTHVDVDEFLVPPPGAPDQPLRALVASHSAARPVPRALSLPCVFYARCPRDSGRGAVGRGGGTLLDAGACAGKAQMHRQKLVAHASAEYLWVHYVRKASRSAGRIKTLDPQTSLVLAHLRGGYALDTALHARAIDSRDPSAAEERKFAAVYHPRMTRFDDQALPCADAAAAAARRLAAMTKEDKAKRKKLGGDVSSCDAEDENRAPFGWCWCLDDAPARFADVARGVLRSTWDEGALAAMRGAAGLEAAWPDAEGFSGTPSRAALGRRPAEGERAKGGLHRVK